MAYGVGKQNPGTDADGILRELTLRQYLTPHRPLGHALGEVVERLGVCPDAAARAMSRLDLDPARPIGRLKRGELVQLARTLFRLWTHSLPATAPAPDHSAPTPHPA